MIQTNTAYLEALNAHTFAYVERIEEICGDLTPAAYIEVMKAAYISATECAYPSAENGTLCATIDCQTITLAA